MSSDTPAPLADAAGPAAAVADTVPTRRCQNCGEPLLGEHCYSCGQPTKGLVRHFSSIIGDFFDSVFELDSRILRTLGPLLLLPGHLSLEYFAGRRVRYVSPVRLFVFLSIITFFSAQLSFSISPDAPGGPVDIETGEGTDTRRLRSARTVEDVERIRDAAVAELAAARADAADVPGVGVGLDIAEQGVKAEAERRIAAIRKSEETGEPLPIEESDDGTISFNGKPWHAETNPLQIAWLPDAVNGKLNQSAARAQENVKRIKKDPNLWKDAFLKTVPTTLFVLLPLFALLLKVAYLFKRRLYMEHLIVALHSHSFLCAGLLLAMLLDAIKGWTGGAVGSLFGALEAIVLIWLPVYLLLMQKRVYRQGWIMTLLKFAVLGTCYFVLLLMGALASMAVSLVSM